MAAAVSAARLSSSTVVTPWYTPAMTRLVICRLVHGQQRTRLIGDGERAHLDGLEMVHIESVAELVDARGAVGE